MNLHVLATGLSQSKDLERLRVRPEFRKATRCMMLAWLALEEALFDFPARDSLSLVLGSSYGELEVTRDFLVTLASSGLARPLLFQTSLHNATTGFVALQLGITGPSVSVSNRFFTGEGCLELASLFLDTPEPAYCLAIAVEASVPTLLEGLQALYDPVIRLDEGAAAMLLTNDAGRLKSGRNAVATIEDVFCQKTGTHLPEGRFYDSDALENLIRAIKDPQAGEILTLAKPDRSCSKISWRRPESGK